VEIARASLTWGLDVHSESILAVPYTRTKNLHVHKAPASEEDQIVRPKRLVIWFSWRPKDGTNSCRGVRDVGSIVVATQDPILREDLRPEGSGQVDSITLAVVEGLKVECTLARIGR
jgi:hypothetical protein